MITHSVFYTPVARSLGSFFFLTGTFKEQFYSHLTNRNAVRREKGYKANGVSRIGTKCFA